MRLQLKTNISKYSYLSFAACMASLLLAAPFSVRAQTASPYSFSGPCASQGSWTQTALQQAQRIGEVARNLKDDPNCKALAVSMQQAITRVQSHLTEFNDSQSTTFKDTQRLSQIPRELDALQNAIASPATPGETTQQASVLAMNRAVEGAVLSSKVTAVEGSVQRGLPILSLANQLKRGADVGYQILDQVIDSIPQTAECVADDQSLGQFAAATVQTAAALFSSGADEGGSRTAKMISKLANFAREYKFSRVLGKLNEQEYLTSISCLVEVTSENFCSTQDTMELFLSGLKSFQLQAPQAGLDSVEEGAQDSKDAAVARTLEAAEPFQGYYILTQHVPVITEWLQKIQIGVDPKLPTDAVFKNSILEEVIGFYQMTNTLLGMYEKERNTVLTQSDLVTKQNVSVNLIVGLAGIMGRESWDNKKNFFLNRNQAIYMAFTLLGIPRENIPPIVTGLGGTFRISPEDYLRQQAFTMDEFKNPNELMEKVGNNLRRLIHEANLAVIEYHNQWFVVDKIGLVDQAATSMIYTVRDSFYALDAYLEQLYSRFERHGEDRTSLPSVVDLRIRIRNIIDAFEKNSHIIGLINEMDEQGFFSGSLEERQAREKEFRDMTDHWVAYLIRTVYDEFMIMLARSGFLLNRMSTLVYQDYATQLKSGIKFNDHVSELMTALGRASFERIMALGAGNPANIQTDLSMAMRINQNNVEALELLFRDKLVGQIAKLRMLEKGILPTKDQVLEDAKQRAYFDANAPLHKYPVTMTDQEYNDLTQRYRLCRFNLDCDSWLALTGMNIIRLSRTDIHYWRFPERYPTTGFFERLFTTESVSPDTPYSTAKYLRGVLCTQALAFNDWRAFMRVCDDAKLVSPLVENALVPAGDASEYLNVNFRTKLSEQHTDVRRNHSVRICAFRDYNRRNLVRWLTLNRQRQSELNRARQNNPTAEQNAAALQNWRQNKEEERREEAELQEKRRKEIEAAAAAAGDGDADGENREATINR